MNAFINKMLDKKIKKDLNIDVKLKLLNEIFNKNKL